MNSLFAISRERNHFAVIFVLNVYPKEHFQIDLPRSVDNESKKEI